MSGSYEWSIDLVNWNPPGTVGDTTVSISATQDDPVAGTTDLTWPAVPGRTYRVDTSTDLITWIPATTLTAATSPTTATVPLTDPVLFVRIVDITHPE